MRALEIALVLLLVLAEIWALRLLFSTGLYASW